jgi:leucyl aminopeptidase
MIIIFHFFTSYILLLTIMRKITIHFLLKDDKRQESDINTTTTSSSINITTHFITNDITNYIITTNVKKLKHLINAITSHSNISGFTIIFDKKIKDELIVNCILAKLNDVIYSYYPSQPTITLQNVSSQSQEFMKELNKYKDIVMNPNKNPETYLKYVVSRVPKSYKANVFKISKDKKYTPTKMFPLTKSVGAGSIFDSYFVHIQPKSINLKKRHIYLIGKAVTFDSGGLNLKVGNSHIEEMKVDMIGSAIILSVLHLLNKEGYDKNYNIHLIIPIVENMIGSRATRPGMIIKSMSNKLVEIVNTDAEGRLCLADGLDYINLYLLKKFKSKDNLIIDIATLTGNTEAISNGISGLIMGNTLSDKYCTQLIQTGETIGEYLDYLKLRPEYLSYLSTTVGDIANVSHSREKCGCLLGGAFLQYFANPSIPWVHLDVASSTFINNLPTSYGINLLYYFIKNL